VNKGALVATLDDTSAKSALEIASALKTQAEDARARMEKLHENKTISEIQWMDVESKYRQAIAAEKLAQKALDDCKLYAPATGIVAGKSLEVGQNVVPSAPVFRIVNIATVKAVVAVPEKDVAMLNVGDKVEVRVGALGDKSFEGKITNKGISANPLSRSYQIEAELKNKSGELLPGMLLEMSIDSKNSVTGVELPASAVLLDEYNRSFVWVVRGGKTMRKNVETSLGNGSQLLVQGIDDGDSVVVKGMSKVGEGDRVQTANQTVVQ
jgi:RND family efflux transporter MFP subunit